MTPSDIYDEGHARAFVDRARRAGELAKEDLEELKQFMEDPLEEA